MTSPFYSLYDVITITGSNVGIGTTTPLRELHVEGGIMADRFTASNSGTVDFEQSTLSNVKRVVLDELTFSSGFTLGGSNMEGMDVVSASNIRADTIAPYLNANIDFLGSTLSNISTVSISKLTSDASHVDVNTKSLSNITTVYTTNVNAQTVTLSNLTSTAAHIDVSAKSLSNVTTYFGQSAVLNTVTLSNLTTTQPFIDVSAKSLSNIPTVFATTLDATTTKTDNLTTSTSATYINVSAKSLSNITDVRTGTATITTLTLSNLTSSTDHIDVTGKSLSNVSVLSVGSLRTDGASIGFSGSDLTGIDTITTTGDVTVGGTLHASNLSVIGEFTTLNTTTSNTEQLIVNNAGTGPALKVIQSGSGSEYSIAEFVDNEDGMAMRILDTGLVGVGTATVTSRMGVYGNLSIGSNYAAIAAPAYGALIQGNVGIGTTTATAKLDVGGALVIRDTLNQYMNTTQFVHGINSADFTSTGSKYAGFTVAWATATSDKKNSFKVNLKVHFTSDTNATFSTIEGVINPIDNTTTTPSGLVIGTPTTTSLNTTDFRFITMTAVRASATSVDVRVNYTANLTPSRVAVYLEIVAPTALGKFTLTPLSGEVA